MLVSIFVKSGWNRKVIPFDAPSKLQEAITITINSTNNVGIKIFEAFSMPFLTPLVTTKCVSSMKIAVQINGFIGSEEKLLK